MTPRLWFVLIVRTAAMFALIPALLFGAAGTTHWSGAWLFLGLFYLFILYESARLARHDPELLKKRLELPVQKGQPLADKLFMASYAILFVLWVAAMGIEVRLGGAEANLALQGVGVVLFLGACVLIDATMRANTFLATAVKLQPGQTVIAHGPYAAIRHPLYAAAFVFFVSAPLIMGSWVGLALGLALGVGLALRIRIEEAELRRALAGYADYTANVRYRLLPGVW